MRQEDENPAPAPPPPTTPSLPTNEEKAAQYQVFMEYRKALFDSLVEVSGRFTQWSLTLAGGGLALSMTYVEKLQPETSSGKYWLVGSWGLFALSLLSALLSLHYSTKSTKSAITHGDEEYRAWETGDSNITRSNPNRYVKATNVFAVISMWMLGLAVVSMATFVLICPPSQKKDEDKKITINLSLPETVKQERQEPKPANKQDNAKPPDTAAKPPDTAAKPPDTAAKPSDTAVSP